MKYLIYKIFSGVGFCNQLFSLETAIYMANISNRKLILLILYPLCHCGHASWDYGYLLNYFTNDFLNYLPNGFDVHYRATPKSITDIISNTDLCKTIKYQCGFNNLVFVDKNLDNNNNNKDISNFLHNRKKEYTMFDENIDCEYVYITQSNASRCFYNFYTSRENYMLMKHICESLKVNTFIKQCAENIYSNISGNKNKNSFDLFCHLRFGDKHKEQPFINRSNETILKNINEYIDGHITNLIKPTIYCIVDNKSNTQFINNMKKYNVVYVDTYLTNNYIETKLINDNMMCHNFKKCKNYGVATALIEMLLCVKGKEFIGTATSTFSHYIQYLRYNENKTHFNYCNMQRNNIQYCRLQQENNCKYPWIKYTYNGGHPVSWHVFWSPDSLFGKSEQLTQNIYTIVNKTDGFGSQLHACFSLIAYCVYNNSRYVHSPFTRMQHNDANNPNFPQIMNDFINIESNYDTIQQISNYENSLVTGVQEGYFVHGSLSPEFFYNNNVLIILREIYNSKPKPQIPNYETSKNNIVLHIRRGDVNATKYPSRWSSDQDYINLLHKTIENVGSDNITNYEIHILSEGEPHIFKAITDVYPDIKLHLSTDIQQTFHMMVIADILIMSKSSFCYCAGLINKNKVVANNLVRWWHKPLKTWSII